ncbi:MAG TPA: SMC-Scp complex subunit ScpB [Candidatus Eisenbacteria bacterium]|jgi:segregation and condensation protein B|nr:SMC-Scp complex subunit ScpB [Candidatus Eisenbacteria bacterium]
MPDTLESSSATVPAATAGTKQILEALLFASDAPVGLSTLVEVLDGPDANSVAATLAEMARDYEESGRGVMLAEIAGGYQILSRRECAPWIDRMLRSRRKVRLSRAGLETLAIVAYKQPVTKVEIDGIRGVDSSGSLHTLLERGLVVIKGRSKGVGRPLVYATSPEFLSYMGINDLADLPELKELSTVLEDRERLEMEPEETAGAASETPPDASDEGET